MAKPPGRHGHKVKRSKPTPPYKEHVFWTDIHRLPASVKALLREMYPEEMS